MSATAMVGLPAAALMQDAGRVRQLNSQDRTGTCLPTNDLRGGQIAAVPQEALTAGGT